MSAPIFDNPKAHRRLSLPDGRTLGFSDFGPEEAPAAFYFHGFPGSRLEAGFFPTGRVRVIGVDRPGYGQSDPSFGRKLADWPEDIEALADHLGLERFSVIGVSGGGPYAAACGQALGDRLNALILLCGLGPPEALGMNDGRLRLLRSVGRRPVTRAVLAALGRRMLMDDRSVQRLWRLRYGVTPTPEMVRQAATNTMLASWREGLGRSSAGMASDSRVYGTPWHFDPEEIDVPVYLWHGRADTVVPVSIGEHYAARIPGIRAVFPEKDGHVGVVINNLSAIADALLAHA